MNHLTFWSNPSLSLKFHSLFKSGQIFCCYPVDRAANGCCCPILKNIQIRCQTFDVFHWKIFKYLLGATLQWCWKHYSRKVFCTNMLMFLHSMMEFDIERNIVTLYINLGATFENKILTSHPKICNSPITHF